LQEITEDRIENEDTDLEKTNNVIFWHSYFKAKIK